jgi:hypothetical protein
MAQAPSAALFARITEASSDAFYLARMMQASHAFLRE